MDTFTEFLAQIEDPRQRDRVAEILEWIPGRFPQLKQRIAWGQPMFTDHGTFIIGFSLAKRHLAVTPEPATVERFAEEIAAAGYECSSMLFRIPWDCPVDYGLLERMIAFNIADKADCDRFWRAPQP